MLFKNRLFIAIFCAFNILATSVSNSKTLTESLEISTENGIFYKLDNTITSHGRTFLMQDLLEKPTADITTLNCRQEIIKELVTNQEVAHYLSPGLKKIASNDKIVTNFINSLDEKTKFLEEFYYTTKWLKKYNSTPAALEIGQLAHLSNLMSSVAQHAFSALVINWLLQSNEPCCSTHEPSCSTSHKHKHSHGHKHGHKKELQQLPPKEISPLVKNIIRAVQIWHIGSHAQELYGVYSVAGDKLNKIKHLQADLIALAQTVQAIQNIYELIEFNPILKSNMQHYSKIEDAYCRKNISEDFKKLLDLLSQKTFKGTVSKFSRFGNILAAFNLVESSAQEMKALFIAIGELDAYLSCSKLILSSTPDKAFAFVEYLDSNKPVIEIDGFWHPLIQSDIITANNIELGLTKNNILLTGPNAGGKSTILKSISSAIYLGQTIGIAPAASVKFTPFKNIFVAIGISDDIKNGKSLFIAEYENTQDILQIISSSGINEFSYCAFDELFKSTNYKKGLNTAFEFLQDIGNSKNVLSVTTTHFGELTELEKSAKLSFVNYTLTPDYSLITGIGQS